MPEKIPAEDLTEQLPEEIGEIDLYQKREKIYTRKIEGFFQRIRIFTGWPLLVAYFFLPWVQWKGQQIVLFDLPSRKFHIFGLTFWPQDFPLLAWVLIISAFALFLVTKLFGRIWCGYTCPQTVWTSMFMWIEQRTEGTRNQRIKLDKAPWSIKKAIKKSLKHILWLGLAFYTGFTFVAYFTPADELVFSFFSLSVSMHALVWVSIFTLLTYINAGWLREQVCMYMCPYARFQSAMFDPNTLIVSYDAARGEKRGSRKKDSNPQALGLGSCVDCELCVQVCPTGIDIRNGLQYECIGCALCIDACDSIMDKMDYPRGLIRYTTENELTGKQKKSRLFLRLDTAGYFIAIAVMIGLFAYNILTREPLNMDIVRDRGTLYEVKGDDSIQNNYTARLMNMTEQSHTLSLSIGDHSHARIIGNNKITIPSGELAELPFRIQVPAEQANMPVIPLTVTARSQTNSEVYTSSETRFLGPGDNPYAE